MYRLLLLFTLISSSLFAQNNQTIVLSSNSTYTYAKAFYYKHKIHLQEQPTFILLSKSGYYMVTTGIYQNKKEVYKAIEKLPLVLKNQKPFRSVQSFDLTTSHKKVLGAYNLPKKEPVIQHNESKLKQMDKAIIKDLLKE